MKQRAQSRTFGPAQLADRAGVSVKTLRHYERRGLLRPKRTPHGWRVYGAAEVERLERVLELRNMGFRLSEIATLLDAPPEAMASAFSDQEARLLERSRELQQSLDAVRRARRAFPGEQENVALPGGVCLARAA